MVDETTRPHRKGFWSYARPDDRHKRLTNLRAEFSRALGQAYGRKVRIYQDQSHTHWGEKWRTRIDEELESADFLVAVITPYYFNRVHCRYELKTATERKLLILPIYYLECELIEDEAFREKQVHSLDPSAAEAASLAGKVAPLQLRDFRKLKNKDIRQEKVQDFLDESAASLKMSLEK